MGGADELGIVQEACGVAYRRVGSSVEFCLILIPGDSRWEFPHGPMIGEEEPCEAALRVARELAGVECQSAGTEPLGNFDFVSGGARRHLTAFLLTWQADIPASSTAENRRQQWFLPEEARARLRRKPMRFMATIAQRRLSGSNL